jgi:hypothetical protein
MLTMVNLHTLHNRLPGKKMDLLRTIHVHDKKRKVEVACQPLVKKLSANTQTKYFCRGISLAVSWWIWWPTGGTKWRMRGVSYAVSLGRRVLTDPVCLST